MNLRVIPLFVLVSCTPPQVGAARDVFRQTLDAQADQVRQYEIWDGANQIRIALRGKQTLDEYRERLKGPEAAVETARKCQEDVAKVLLGKPKATAATDAAVQSKECFRVLREAILEFEAGEAVR